TFAFMNHGLAKFGVRITHVDMTQPELVAKALSKKTKVVYFETPANPNMRLVDIAAISDLAHDQGATVVVDNTYATPYLTRPISFGADIVVHSATKYLGGHGDLVAGLVVGRSDTIAEIRLVGLKDMTGAVMAPLNALLVQRGLKTLALRMERHSQSAQKVAEWLSLQPQIATISYPGLPEFDQFDLAQRQMARPGGMIAFEMVGGIAAGRNLINRLHMIQRAVSLGDAETLIQLPASMTHSTYSPEERAAHGISDGLVRLSIGLEDTSDILADLSQAMADTPMAVAV
ncbi:MAG: aminotransferase class V-fold PLP-dependent enzyme, partial [Pseudomonadota bacterium]